MRLIKPGLSQFGNDIGYRSEITGKNKNKNKKIV